MSQEPDQLSLQERFIPDGFCFGCGPVNPHGLRIRSFPRDEPERTDGVVCDWQPEAFHQAFENCLNGGIVGALLDCHCNWTAGWHLMRREGLGAPPLTVTASFEVRLKRPTPMVDPVHLESWVVASEGAKVTVEATLAAGGRVTATFSGRFVAVGPDHPAARHGLPTWTPPE